jgi:hypothetical protein
MRRDPLLRTIRRSARALELTGAFAFGWWGGAAKLETGQASFRVAVVAIACALVFEGFAAVVARRVRHLSFDAGHAERQRAWAKAREGART